MSIFQFVDDVLKKHLVAGTKVVAALHLRCSTTRRRAHGQTFNQAVFGAAAKTEMGHITVQALSGKAVQFVLAKTAVGLHHVIKGRIHDVAYTVFRKYIPVTSVKVSILFYHSAMTTDSLMNTQTGRTAGQIANGSLNYLNKLVAYIFL